VISHVLTGWKLGLIINAYEIYNKYQADLLLTTSVAVSRNACASNTVKGPMFRNISRIITFTATPALVLQ
jgi:hypothetical protein